MKIYWQNGKPVQSHELTAQQVWRLVEIHENWDLADTVHISPMFGGDKAILIDVGTMILAVEPDGYVHS